jgi:hypothetical protein
MAPSDTTVLALVALVVPPLVLALVWSEASRAAVLGFLELSLRRVQARFHPRPAMAWLGWARAAHRGALARAFVAEAARTGDPEGLLEEALLLWEGAAPGGKGAAGPRFLRAAEQGHADAMAWVAEDLRWGGSGPADPEGSKVWLRRGTEAGSGACMARLALELRGAGEEADAARWEALLAASGADPALRRSLVRPRAGEEEPDPLTRTLGRAAGTAQAWFERPGLRPVIPVLGWSAVMFVAGMVLLLLVLPFLYGGIFAAPMAVCLAMLLPMAWRMRWERRPAQAHRRHLDAAQAGDPRAAYALGMAYAEGRDGLPKDPGEARRWLRISAEAGHLDAMVALAEHLGWNLGGPRDPRGREAWLRRAAEAGHLGARGRLEALGASSEAGHTPPERG